MLWYIRVEGTNNPNPTETNIWVMDLNASGTPTANILFNKMNVPTNKGVWVEYKFPTPIDCPNGFYIAVSNGHEFTAIGLTDVNSQYPFTNNTHYITQDYNYYSYSTLESNGISNKIFMIRAEGYNNGKSSNEIFGYEKQDFDIHASSSYSMNTELAYTCSTDVRCTYIPLSSPVETEEDTNSKSLQSYSVYRLMQGQPEPWTLLSENVSELTYTDTNWGNLPAGNYQWAVKAKYSSGTSNTALSNVLTVAQPTKYQLLSATDLTELFPAVEQIFLTEVQ